MVWLFIYSERRQWGEFDFNVGCGQWKQTHLLNMIWTAFTVGQIIFGKCIVCVCILLHNAPSLAVALSYYINNLKWYYLWTEMNKNCLWKTNANQSKCTDHLVRMWKNSHKYDFESAWLCTKTQCEWQWHSLFQTQFCHNVVIFVI